MDWYGGIDPGKSGGVCILDKEGKIKFLFKCPDNEIEMANSLNNLLQSDNLFFADCFIIIEKVWAFKGQGVTSCFTFGKNFGTWLGILAALKLPHMEVPPQKWMKHYGNMPKDKKDRKNHIKRLVQQRYPNEKITLNTADAVLIALYNYETYNKLKESD